MFIEVDQACGGLLGLYTSTTVSEPGALSAGMTWMAR